MATRLQGFENNLTVADGGWSTILRARGFDPRVPAELCSLLEPRLVEQLCAEYIAAGARILTTNTFSASRFGFARWKRDDWRDACRAGAEIARRAADEAGASVAGSVGPSGRIVAVKETQESDLQSGFAEAADALAQGGADLIVLETFTELAEALLALKAIRERCALPIVACMSFGYGPQRTQTQMGAEAALCASALQEAGADAVGYTCGAGVEHALPAVVALRANSALPLWVKPSVGLPELRSGRPHYYQTPDEFAVPMQQIVRAGANVVGGCCGAGPEHIRRLGELVEPGKRRSRT